MRRTLLDDEQARLLLEYLRDEREAILFLANSLYDPSVARPLTRIDPLLATHASKSR